MNHSLTLDTRLHDRILQLPGHRLDWMNQFRQEHLAAFTTTDPGGKQDKQWHLSAAAAADATDPPHLDPAWLERYRLPDVFSLVWVDGVFCPHYCRREGLPAGVCLKSLDELSDAELTELRPDLTQPGLHEADALMNWNLAWLQSGAFLRIPERVHLEKPVQLLCITTAPVGLVSLRHVIRLGRNSRATLIHTQTGQAGASGTTGETTAIWLEQAAVLAHYSLQTQPATARHFARLDVATDTGACFHQHHLALGAARALTDIQIRAADQVSCELNGLFYADGNRQTAIHTRVQQAGSQGITRETYRGIATDKAHGVFEGLLQLQPDVRRITATLQNRNLLLSPQAQIDSRPQLEINAEDVQCSHGVTVGQLDEDAVFFLVSRGLSEAEARTLLSFAFANEIIGKIPLTACRDQARQAFLDALPQADIHQDWL